MDEIAKEYDVIVLGTGKCSSQRAPETPHVAQLAKARSEAWTDPFTGLTECILSG